MSSLSSPHRGNRGDEGECGLVSASFGHGGEIKNFMFVLYGGSSEE
jgi:hypothetical protein